MTENQWTEDPAYTRPPDPLNQTPASGTTGMASGTGSAKEAVKGEASEIAQTTRQSAQHVAETARSEASTVATEAKNNARDLLSQARDDLSSQAGAQQQKVASGLRSISDELQSMASSSDQQGMATDLVRQAADRSASVAQWLEGRDPGALLDEVKSFARQRPGAFLMLAAGAGVLAGRLSRSLTGGGESDASSQTGSATYGSGTPVQPAGGGTVPPPAVELPGPATTTAGYSGVASTTDPYTGAGTSTGAGPYPGTGAGTGAPLADDPETGWPETGGPR